MRFLALMFLGMVLAFAIHLGSRPRHDAAFLDRDRWDAEEQVASLTPPRPSEWQRAWWAARAGRDVQLEIYDLHADETKWLAVWVFDHDRLNRAAVMVPPMGQGFKWGSVSLQLSPFLVEQGRLPDNPKVSVLDEDAEVVPFSRHQLTIRPSEKVK